MKTDNTPESKADGTAPDVVCNALLGSLAERIMGELKKQSKAPYEYINPHFLAQITDALGEYYNVEDEGVDKWVNGMWSA